MKTVISTQTKAEYNELMEYLESKGYLWASKKKPTEINLYSKGCVYGIDDENEIYWHWLKDNPNAIPFSELKANNYKIEIEL